MNQLGVREFLVLGADCDLWKAEAGAEVEE